MWQSDRFIVPSDHPEIFSHACSTYVIFFFGIFSSFTRDGFQDDSDVDIFIEFDQPIGIEFIDLANGLEELLKMKVVFNPLFSYLMESRLPHKTKR